MEFREEVFPATGLSTFAFLETPSIKKAPGPNSPGILATYSNTPIGLPRSPPRVANQVVPVGVEQLVFMDRAGVVFVGVEQLVLVYRPLILRARHALLGRRLGRALLLGVDALVLFLRLLLICLPPKTMLVLFDEAFDGLFE